MGLPLETPIVMLATNPMERSEWRKLVFTFCDAFRGCADVVAVVRLHPVEKCSTYGEEISFCQGLRFFENKEWTMEESMAACDVVVGHNSGLGNDALVLGRPVVLLDVVNEALSNGQGLVDRAGCPVAHSAQELCQIVTRIVTDGGYRQSLHECAEKYVRWFCSAYGQQAARNVADEVRKRINT
jgi:hypothetical protein